VYLRGRVTEIPGLHYSVAYPHREFETGRDMARSPLHDQMVSHGARFGQRLTWERPLWFAAEDESDIPEDAYTFGKPAWFESIAREHLGTRGAAAVFDMTAFGKFRVEGPDAARFLTRLCANDVDVAHGQTVYTQMLNDAGGIEDDVTTTRLDESSFLVIAGSMERTRCGSWMAHHQSSQLRVEIDDVTEAYAVLGVMGPKSRAILSNVCDIDLSASNAPYGRALRAHIAGKELLTLRTSYVGELGWELHIPRDDATAVYEAIVAAGTPEGLIHAGAFAMDSLRLESGMRAWGRELKPDVTPIEAGLGRFVRHNGGFVGAEVVEKQRREAPTKRIVTLVTRESDCFLHGNEPVLRDGVVCGWTTSGAFGHSLDRAVAMALVHDDEGIEPAFFAQATFMVQVGDRHVVADVFEGPALPPPSMRDQEQVDRTGVVRPDPDSGGGAA
jgi:sarcosine dehydrogenase